MEGEDIVLDQETLKQMYREMMFIRRSEETIDEYAKKGEIPGFVHLGVGQEAVQVGTVHAIRKTDYKFPDHRCHGAISLFGTDKKKVMAEIFGKATGTNGGRGGSMHITDLSVRNMGNNGVQGSSVVSVLGPAFYAQLKKTDDVSVVWMGDGTLGEGACHESINLAATWKLPVVYVLANNQYAIAVNYREAYNVEQLATWAKGYDVPSEVVDGNDVVAVYEAMTRAVERARKGEGPTVLELMTYRWQGHFAGDPAAYRPKEEVEYWKGRCPIKKLKKDLMAEGVPEEEFDAMDESVEKEIQELVQYALDSPLPKPEDAMKHVYANREVEVHNV